jgi:hypothetical protein
MASVSLAGIIKSFGGNLVLTRVSIVHVDHRAPEPIIARFAPQDRAELRLGGAMHLSVKPAALLLFSSDGRRLRAPQPMPQRVRA